MSCIINSCTVSSPSHGIVGKKGCHVLIPVQCTFASPSHGIVGRRGCHALIAVQSLFFSMGLWGGKEVIY